MLLAYLKYICNCKEMGKENSYIRSLYFFNPLHKSYAYLHVTTIHFKTEMDF